MPWLYKGYVHKIWIVKRLRTTNLFEANMEAIGTILVRSNGITEIFRLNVDKNMVIKYGQQKHPDSNSVETLKSGDSDVH